MLYIFPDECLCSYSHMATWLEIFFYIVHWEMLEIFSSVGQRGLRYSLSARLHLPWPSLPPCMGRVNNPANVHTYLVCIT